MAEFYIGLNRAEANAMELERLKRELDEIASDIFAVRNNLSFQTRSAMRIKQRLRDAVEQVEDEAAATRLLSDKLQEILEVYKRYEQKIVGRGNETEVKAGANAEVSEADTGDDKEEMSFESAVDFLQGLLNGTNGMINLDSNLVTMLTYILDAFELGGADAAKLLDKTGFGLGVAGLVISIATDVMNALDNGSTTNALYADIIVDICLWGVGEISDDLGGWIGSKVGTAIAGPVGYIAGEVIGEFVGGLVGSGISWAMEQDWDGDGASGKDELSEWIDNLLDKFMGDSAIPAYI